MHLPPRNSGLRPGHGSRAPTGIVLRRQTFYWAWRGERPSRSGLDHLTFLSENHSPIPENTSQLQALQGLMLPFLLIVLTGKHIRAARGLMGWSQQELAKRDRKSTRLNSSHLGI